MSENVDHRLLTRWEAARRQHAEEQRFLRVIHDERGQGPVRPCAELVEDQLAVLRDRVDRQRAALRGAFPGDEPA